VPNVTCAWCTLRVRYHPNKPTEPIFHNCADIAIVAALPPNLTGRIFTSLQRAPLDFVSQWAEILPNGQVVPQTGDAVIHADEPSLNPILYVANGVVGSYLNGANWRMGFWNLAGVQKQFYKAMPPGQIVYHQPPATTSLVSSLGNLPNETFAFAGIVPVTGQLGVLLVLQLPANVSGKWHYKVYRSFPACAQDKTQCGPTTLVFQTPPEDLYVNYFWSVYDLKRNTIYILSGHEDEPVKLHVRIYSFAIGSTAPQQVDIISPLWTFDHIHVEPSTGMLLSVSQGRLGESRWSLVATDPKTGKQTVRGTIADGAQYASRYGGGVYQGMSSLGVLHIFTNTISDARTLVVLDPTTARTVYKTDIGLGVNSQALLQNVIFVPN